MEDYVNNADVKNEQAKDVSPPANDLPIKTQLRYDTAFSLLIAPLIATRYIWVSIEKVNPWNIIKKLPSTLGANFAALGTGAAFLSIMGVYSKNTLHDIRSIYAGAVGYELGKPKDEVTYHDIFFKSQNEALKITRSAYESRTIGRLATLIPFVVPWHKFGTNVHPYAANAEAGVGTVGVSLLAEGFMRAPSFFDLEQKLAITAINHTDNKTIDNILPKNIFNLLMLQRNAVNKNYMWAESGSPEGQNDLAVSTRIASLMNQTYKNLPNTENANFDIGKLNYLIGFGLLDKFPESLAFVELANKSNDMNMSEVKQAAAAIKNGQDSQSVFRNFGIDINAPVKSENVEISDINVATQKFMSNVRQINREPIMPKTLMDYAAQTTELKLG
jgi:hypothetical protein